MALDHPRIEEKPALQADSLNLYIHARLRSASIDIHSAFQLHHEAVRFGRLSYRQPAWGQKLYLRGIIQILMHGLTAHALGCIDQAKITEDWFIEDLPLLREIRPHYIGDQLNQGRQLFHDDNFIRLLADTRRLCNEKSLRGEDLPDGPYHFDVFPYDYAVPEQELLFPGTCLEFDKTAPFDPDVEAILVKLLTSTWG